MKIPALTEFVAQIHPRWIRDEKFKREDNGSSTPKAGPRSPTIPENWPAPLEPAALHGLAGDVVRTIDPHTEADRVAILLQFLVAFGNVVGRKSYFQVESTCHHCNLFVVLVGDTAKARKGTSWNHIDRLFSQEERTATTAGAWRERVITGLTSGEGVIWNVRDACNLDDGTRATAIADKRRIVLDGEFASTLKVLGRQGNNLSPVIRNAWDSGNLAILTKNTPARATEAHISIVAHITRDELRRELTATEQGNGFANRFLWCCVRRSKSLPDGGTLQDGDLGMLVDRLRRAIRFAEATEEMRRDEGARARWRAVYDELSEGRPGLVGAIAARAEAQVVRLACLYALLDQSTVVRPEHLEAALAVWRYCEASVVFIFDDTTGDAVADRILAALRKRGTTDLSRTQIRDLFQRNQSRARIDSALALLEERGLAERREWKNGVQSTELWVARHER